METIARIFIDTSKSVFQLHGVNAAEEMVIERRMGRDQMVPFFSKLPPTLIGMEACGGAHHWARVLGGLGHEVKLIAPPGVGPIGASLLVMKAPDPSLFRSGRQFAAWLGLTPKDHSTAGKQRLGVITRAGDEALRSVSVVGATAAIKMARRGKGPCATPRKPSWPAPLARRANRPDIWMQTRSLFRRRPPCKMGPSTYGSRISRCAPFRDDGEGLHLRNLFGRGLGDTFGSGQFGLHKADLLRREVVK